MSFQIFVKLVRATFIISLLIFCLGITYKFFYHKVSTSEWAKVKRQKMTAELENFRQISTISINEEFTGIYQLQQQHLKTIELVNLKVNRTLLIESLKYCKKLQVLRLVNITLIAGQDFSERVHLPNLKQYFLKTQTIQADQQNLYFVEDDLQRMKKFRSWDAFKTLIPFTTMGFQQAKSAAASATIVTSSSSDPHKKFKIKSNVTTNSQAYSIEDFNWLVVTSRTDLDIRIGAIKLFTVIHSQALLLSFLKFNQKLLHQIQQPNQFELKHLYLLDGEGSIAVDTLPSNLYTLFSYKLYEPKRTLTRKQIKSVFEIKISTFRRIQELRIFLHPNVKWFDLYSITPVVRHLAISNAILTNHFNVRFLFVQNLALDVYLIDDETIVNKLPSIFPYCRKVVLDFSSINSEVAERKILTQVLQLPMVEWIIVRFYQIRRFKIWTENWEIEKFLDKLGIGEDSDSFMISRNLSKPNEWKGVDLSFDQVRLLTGQLSADADDFIISQVEL